MNTFKQFCESREHPTKNELHNILTNEYRDNLHQALYIASPTGLAAIKFKVLDMFIVGSYAKGTTEPDSDLDIAVIIPEIPRTSALDFSEIYHSTFNSNEDVPHWNDIRVDFQFFYKDDPQLQTYSKISLN